ncbi:hypothetical protein [Jeotgalibacillus sp. R-1-5s-1]|uniref:hypothetical protein n=1 Tax=Jeotgalibacillus sp. R-1-5s-1 TaxID=2555897 RepID=UPI00106BC36E|nr:hypothetical protein [Jeotgalibacillus sp. R-1-5s-1]TFD95304.1 hypothetical protein E2491_12510 [Jeotgalibacillus sp. R-1-5s-1]
MLGYIIAICTAVIALGITFNYIAHLGTMVKTAEGRGEQGMTVSTVITRFMFSTMLIELIPIVIIVLSFVLLDSPTGGFPVIPIVIMVGATVFGAVQILIRMKQDVPAEARGQVRSFSMIAMQLVITAPLVGLIFLFI